MKSGNYSILLNDFALEIDLDVELSVQYTRNLRHHGANFLFAVAELWMRRGDKRFLIVPKSNPGNFFEDVSAIASAVLDPPRIEGLERMIGRGGWCSWMASYWDRLDSDMVAADDDERYECLIRLSILESRVGHLAIYAFENSSIIEVATRSRRSSERFVGWASFEGQTLKEQLDALVGEMSTAIRRAL